MSISQVLHINVRLSEGGAAGVARTLADELSTRGIRSPMAYGYGPHGRSSSLEASTDSFRLTPKHIAAANRVNYLLSGRETRFVDAAAGAKLEAAMQESDVVHLHVIHSYFLETDYLFDLMIKLHKPVVWTLHDHWAMTGRCAQPDACSRWAEGCRTCPSLQAYPPAKFDFAAKRWEQRRASIARLQDSVPTAIVPCADWLAIDAEESGFRNVQVIKNSVDRAYWEATRAIAGSPRLTHPKVSQGNIFVCRDLRDRSKVDWDLLGRIAAIPGQHLTIVGDHAPTQIPGVEYVPATSDRSELAHLLARHDRLIFTSTVDYYPLTIAEALTAGLHVFAIRSRASKEFAESSLVNLFDTSDFLLASIQALSNQSQVRPEMVQSPDFFNPDRMVDEYIDLYERVS